MATAIPRQSPATIRNAGCSTAAQSARPKGERVAGCTAVPDGHHHKRDKAHDEQTGEQNHKIALGQKLRRPRAPPVHGYIRNEVVGGVYDDDRPDGLRFQIGYTRAEALRRRQTESVRPSCESARTAGAETTTAMPLLYRPSLPAMIPRNANSSINAGKMTRANRTSRLLSGSSVIAWF